jgi:hypothetical protein
MRLEKQAAQRMSGMLVHGDGSETFEPARAPIAAPLIVQFALRPNFAPAFYASIRLKNMR